MIKLCNIDIGPIQAKLIRISLHPSRQNILGVYTQYGGQFISGTFRHFLFYRREDPRNEIVYIQRAQNIHAVLGIEKENKLPKNRKEGANN